MRLDKLLGDAGLGTRKELKKLIKSGRVTVDGAAAVRPETQVDPETSRVVVDGEQVAYSSFHYYMMDKPIGVVTATEDKKQKTVLDLLPERLRRMGLFPVGRLDKDTSGLLLLTDDGDFAHRVISPKFYVEKMYYAKVEGELEQKDADAFAQGVILRDGTRCLPAGLEILGRDECLVTVREGKYHQVRRMLASRGKPVKELRRLTVGALELDDGLGAGGFRELNKDDLCRVFKKENAEK